LKNSSQAHHLRLPSFDCPNPECHARNLIFAASVEARNQSKLVPLEDVPKQTTIDFVVCCPKCKRQYAMVRVIHAPIIPFNILPIYTAAN
jgi:hypothetical protein